MRKPPRPSSLEDEILQYPTVHEARLYEKLSAQKVRCHLCERRCLIAPRGKGFCKTRMNLDGTLYTLVYGDISGAESRPIEIKPFFHYWPGSTAFTFSTWSCNFRCPWCQNFSLSRGKPQLASARYISPETMVEMALNQGDKGICVSFNEPTLLFEYSCDVFKISREMGLYNCYVSNGYLSLEAMHMLFESGMDAIKIDLKGDARVYREYCGNLDVEIVWRNAKEAKKMGLHVEVVNLVITGVNDSQECLRWVIERHLREVGRETPLHFTRYYPAYKFDNPPTSVKTLEAAYQMAVRAGVLFPYLGNVAGHKHEDTYCPSCGKLLIRRLAYTIVEYKITADKKCSNCGWHIPIVGEYTSESMISKST